MAALGQDVVVFLYIRLEILSPQIQSTPTRGGTRLVAADRPRYESRAGLIALLHRLGLELHECVTHNKCDASFKDFADATRSFLRVEMPRNWPQLCDPVPDGFGVINPQVSASLELIGAYLAVG